MAPRETFLHIPFYTTNMLPPGEFHWYPPSLDHPTGYLVLGEGTDIEAFKFDLNTRSEHDQRFLKSIKVAVP